MSTFNKRIKQLRRSVHLFSREADPAKSPRSYGEEVFFMNWEPVIIAWIVLLGIAILGIIAIQTAPRIHNAFRRPAQIMFCVLILAFDVFAVIAEYYRINFLWSILFAPAV